MSLRCPSELQIYRRTYHGEYGDDTNGIMIIPARDLRIMFSDGGGWEHVSVSRPERCPSWEEMEWVKHKFWDDADTVMQLHVPLGEHISTHPYCLHMWRPIGVEIPRPPAYMVG